MRVLQWLNSFLPDTGGIQTFCADLVPEMQRRGHEILLLAAHTKHEVPDADTVRGIEVRRVDSLRPLLRQEPGGILRSQIEIGRIIDEFDPDLVHIHPCGPELPYFLRTQAKRPTPCVMTLHNNYADLAIELGGESFFGRTLDTAARIVAVSEDARRWLLSERPDVGDKTETVHNGIPDLERASDDPLPWDPPVLGYVGRLEPQKRVDVLVDAFADVARRHPTARLRIAGDGTDASALRAQVAARGLDARVEFLGMVAPEAVPGLLEDTTIFVMSSDYEGLPIALLEAARHGRPTVSTDVGGVREVVDEGKSGLLVARGEPSVLADALMALLDDPTRAEAFGRAARRRFDAEFDLATCASSYERLYAEAAQQLP